MFSVRQFGSESLFLVGWLSYLHASLLIQWRTFRGGKTKSASKLLVFAFVFVCGCMGWSSWEHDAFGVVDSPD
jgi:hypothetical protein